MQVARLTADKCIVCFEDQWYGNWDDDQTDNGEDLPQCRVLTFDNMTITMGANATLRQSEAGQFMSVTAASSSNAIACYQDKWIRRASRCNLLGIEGYDVQVQGDIVLQRAEADWTTVGYLGDGAALVCYTDEYEYSYDDDGEREGICKVIFLRGDLPTPLPPGPPLAPPTQPGTASSARPPLVVGIGIGVGIGALVCFVIGVAIGRGCRAGSMPAQSGNMMAVTSTSSAVDPSTKI